MACNAFGIMLGIFVVLFGISYPEEEFPGGYSGKTTAGAAGVFMFFTVIGYCGAHHQKAYFLILYSVIILLFLGGNVAVWIISPSQTLFHPATKQFYVMATIMLLVMGLAFFLAYQVSHQEPTSNQRNSSVNSATNSSQAQQQQQNQQSQQQQIQMPSQQTQQLQSSSNTITGNTANGTHHYQQPSLQAHFQTGQLLNNNCIPPPNQPTTMTVKGQNGYPPSNQNMYFKSNAHSNQMPGVYVQLPAIPPRYSQTNTYS